MSTARFAKVSGEDGAATVDATFRVVELAGSDQDVLVASISGPIELEAGEPFTLTPTATGAGALSWTWTQTGGPTVENTGLDNFEGVAPASSTGTTLVFEVTGNPGGSTDTHTITVYPASEYRLRNGEWVPYIKYVLIGGPPTTSTGHNGGTAGESLFALSIDGGSASNSGGSGTIDGGSA